MSTPRTNRRLKSISLSPSARCRVQSKREGWEAKVLAWTVRTKAKERTCWKKQEMTNLSQVHIKQPGYITYKSHQAETISLTNPQLHQALKARGEYIGEWRRSSVIARDSFLPFPSTTHSKLGSFWIHYTHSLIHFFLLIPPSLPYSHLIVPSAKLRHLLSFFSTQLIPYISLILTWWAREGSNCGSRPALPAAPAFTSVPSWHSSPPNPAFSCHHFLTCVNIVAGYTHRFGSTVMWRRSSNRLRSTRTFNVKSLFRWNLFRWCFRCLQPVSYIWSSSADMKYECDFWERRVQTKLGNSVENVQKHGRTQVAVTVVFSETIASAKDWEKRPTCSEASGEDHLFLKRFEEMSLQDVRRKCVSIDLNRATALVRTSSISSTRVRGSVLLILISYTDLIVFTTDSFVGILH